MEQEVHMQHDEFFALHDALWEPVQHLELVTGQTMPNYGSQYGINQKSTDISTNNGGQPVAAAANPLSTGTLVRADSPRTSIDPLDFISLECCGGISLTQENLGDFEFIMDCAINCSFDGSHVPTSIFSEISIDGGPNQTPSNSNEGTGLFPETPASSTNGFEAKNAAAAKDDYVMTSGGAILLPSNEGISYMVLDGSYESRHQEKDEKPCTLDQFSEAIREGNRFWDGKIRRGYLAKPIAVGLKMLSRICAHQFIPA